MKRFSLFRVVPLLAAVVIPLASVIAACFANFFRAVKAGPDLHRLGHQLRLVRSDKTKARAPRQPFIRFEAEMTRMAAARGV